MAVKGRGTDAARDGRVIVGLALAALILLPLLFYAGMIFGGREPAAPDTMAVRPLGAWARQAEHALGTVPLWIPHIFSGMPSYGSYIYTPASPLSPLDWILRPFAGARGARYFLFFLLGGLSAFAFFRRQRVSAPAAAAAALAFVLTPYIPGVIEAGHSTKLRALMHVPLVLLTLDLFLERPGPLAAAALALAGAMLGWSNHPQILYYTGIIAVLYTAGSLWAGRAEWSGPRLARGAVWFLLAGVAALLLISEPTLAVREYAPYSIRGTGEGGGVSWSYATAWSFPPREMVTFLFPDFFGLKGATYFGSLPFTQSTHYFGIVLLAVVVLGFLRRRDARSWIWLVISLVVLIVGFGEHIPILYKPFYVLLPYFNKFRVPSMFYSLLPLCLGYIVATGIDALSGAAGGAGKRQRSPSTHRRWLLAAGTALAIGVIGLAVGTASRAAGPAGAGWVRGDELRGLPPAQIDALRQARWDMRIESIVRGMILIALFLAAVPLSRRLRPPAGAALLGAILVADVVIVGAKFLDFADKAEIDSALEPTAQIEYLKGHLNGQEGPFRILDVDGFSSNRYAAFGISSVGGYQPAKLRIYQDLLDKNLLMNPPVLAMLNARYLLSRTDPGHPSFARVADGVYEFGQAQPRVWFVPSWRSVPDEDQVLRALGERSFDPAASALFTQSRAPGLPQEGLPVRAVRAEEVSPHLLRIHVAEGEGPGLLIVSEIFYPAGWTASIDGVPAPILPADHCLRAVVVPAGAHTVEMRFSSRAVRLGRILDRAGGLLLLCLAGAGAVQRRRSASMSR